MLGRARSLFKCLIPHPLPVSLRPLSSVQRTQIERRAKFSVVLKGMPPKKSIWYMYALTSPQVHDIFVLHFPEQACRQLV